MERAMGIELTIFSLLLSFQNQISVPLERKMKDTPSCRA